jgi:hypothetical protein
MTWRCAEPYWYQGFPSPYYTANHKAFRAKVRAFVETEIKPNVDKWIKEVCGMCCAVLCCAVLCCAVLCYAVLCCPVI